MHGLIFSTSYLGRQYDVIRITVSSIMKRRNIRQGARERADLEWRRFAKTTLDWENKANTRLYFNYANSAKTDKEKHILRENLVLGIDKCPAMSTLRAYLDKLEKEGKLDEMAKYDLFSEYEERSKQVADRKRPGQTDSDDNKESQKKIRIVQNDGFTGNDPRAEYETEQAQYRQQQIEYSQRQKEFWQQQQEFFSRKPVPSTDSRPQNEEQDHPTQTTAAAQCSDTRPFCSTYATSQEDLVFSIRHLASQQVT